jgi:hypothetical protein
MGWREVRKRRFVPIWRSLRSQSRCAGTLHAWCVRIENKDGRCTHECVQIEPKRHFSHEVFPYRKTDNTTRIQFPLHREQSYSHSSINHNFCSALVLSAGTTLHYDVIERERCGNI